MASLDLLKTAEGYGVSTLSVSDAFISDYDIYKVIVNPVQVNSFDWWYWRFLNSSNAEITGSNYKYAHYEMSSYSGYTLHDNNGTTTGQLGYGGAKTVTDSGAFNITVYNPYNSDSYTFLTNETAVFRTTSGLVAGRGHIVLALTETVKGFKVYSNSASVGNVAVEIYGVNQ